MMIEINTLWFIPMVFIPFVLGVLAGLRVMKQKITMHLLSNMDIKEFNKLMEDTPIEQI